MTKYLGCMKKVRGMNDPECRNLAKSYLGCRMDKYVSFINNRKYYIRIKADSDVET